MSRDGHSLAWFHPYHPWRNISWRVFRRRCPSVLLHQQALCALAVGKIREWKFGTTENRWIEIRIGDWALTDISLPCVREACKVAGVQDRAPSFHSHQFYPLAVRYLGLLLCLQCNASLESVPCSLFPRFVVQKPISRSFSTGS